MSNSQIRSSSTKRRRILDELAEISAVNSIQYDESENLEPPHEIQNINDILVPESDTLHEGTMIF